MLIVSPFILGGIRRRARATEKALVAVVLVASCGAARAEDGEPPEPYKPGEVFPLTLVHGVDFLEPLLPVAAFERGDAGRIVLDSALPWALLASSFAARGTDRSTLAEIGRWKWAGVDQSQDNYPMLFGLCALAGASSLIPAPAEDGPFYSWRLRLDRLCVFAASIGIANLEVELLKPVFHRTRPDGNGAASRPSGHAASAFAAMAFLSDVLRDTFRPQDQPNLGLRIAGETVSALPYLGAFYVALERVHGQKHYLTDTLLGGALGAFTTHMLYEWSFLRTELGHGWADSFSLAYVPGGFQLAWSKEF
jgi:membrane-associated phospholipid phosphatase